MAGVMTVMAFACRRMLALRSAAIAANLLFIVYGAKLGLKPILVLHCLLLPLNILRFADCLRRASTEARKTSAPPVGPALAAPGPPAFSGAPAPRDPGRG
jgi:hypothetical protein